ncbi:site-specific integrase [Solibacillus sp.]|uniref:tyrosine-type recombinase/integrase n=1 Tax=Solibacillus sp. TaxID=1909654 RepID=UPI0033160231
MYFEQLAKDKWKCIGDGPRNPVTGKRKLISRRGKTKAEAKKRVLEAIEHARVSFEYNEKITFAEFCEQFMVQYRLRGNKETTNIYREYCLSLFVNYIGNVKITAITAKQLQDILNDLFDKKVAHNTLKGTHNAIKQLFKHAADANLISVSPAETLFVPKQKMQLIENIDLEIRKLYLESAELKQLLNEADKHRNVLFRTAVYLIAFTGMRPGEAFALKKSDIDFNRKVIHITKTMAAKNSIKGEFELTPPKTLNAIRIIDIDDIVVEKIKYLLNFKYLKDWEQSEFIFGDKTGVPPTIKSLNQFCKRLGMAAKISKQCRTYILRHTHISLLAEANVDLPYIMNRVGHLNSKTTTQIYLHVTEGMRKNAASMMHKKFTQLLTQAPENTLSE